MDLKYFGFVLKDIRRKLKYTQEYVSKHAYMSTKHLSRIENGKIYPSLEDLMHLSNLYKKNLIELFAIYYNYYDKNVIDLIDNIEHELIDFNYYNINTLIDKIEIHIENNRFIKQYYYFIKGVLFLEYYKQKDMAFSLFIKALFVFNNNFNINKYYLYNYSSLELRILTALALYFNKIDDYATYTNLLSFSFKNCEDNSFSYFIILIHYINLLKKENKIKESLRLVNKYLHSSFVKKNLFLLPTIYYMKFRIYERDNNLNKAKENLKKASLLCQIYRKNNLENLINEKLSLYHI